MNILFVGDVFGSAGRHIVREHVPHVLETHAVDLFVINGENAAGGFGITPSLAEEFFDLGAHVITTGNHIWDKREIFEYMAVPADSHVRGRRILRPANYAVGTPGFGFYQGELPSGQEYAVMNLQGRVFMSSCDDPFRKADELLSKITAKVILLDIHGEATSEKAALGWYLDGRVTAVLGQVRGRQGQRQDVRFSDPMRRRDGTRDAYRANHARRIVRIPNRCTHARVPHSCGFIA